MIFHVYRDSLDKEEFRLFIFCQDCSEKAASSNQMVYLGAGETNDNQCEGCGCVTKKLPQWLRSLVNIGA